jgi:type I restriction enzyme R subunit
MKFTEEKLEKAFTELLGQEGFPHHLGITIVRKPDEVLIEETSKTSVVITSQLRCEVTTIQSIFKMSSYFANKLDKSIIFALQ